MNAQEIKEYRKRNGLTQDELANIVMQTTRAVQSWEQGQRNVTQSAVALMKLYEENKGTVLINGNSGFVSGKNIISGNNHKINQGGVYNEDNIPTDLLEIIRKKDEQIAQKDEQINKLIELLSNKQNDGR